MSEAQAELRALLASYWKPHAVVAAARLGLADALGDEALDAATLATRIGADAEHLHRFCRALAAIGLIDDRGDGTFALAEMGQRLRAGHPESLKGMALHVGTRLSPGFATLHECVMTGAPAAGSRYGPSGFAELNEDDAAAAVFNQSMV
ncbi:MAG TPA: methyltransferase dimerization domain-containing protein, partial [Paracoccaceae bacterium]|nr:methyltransferase dimerization domain-containing protein [Paracoccaceae bacterium]